MSQRTAIIERAKAQDANISALSREYGVSRKTVYKWLNREQAGGQSGLADQSRRPKHSPRQTEANIEAQVLAVREAHPAWGGRKIRRVLQNQGVTEAPAASTITAILRRNQQMDLVESLKHQPIQRFEREQPNELWQMDFKGFFALERGGYCHPLTVIDDHSRFLVGLRACPNQRFETVQSQLTVIFKQFGLPERMLMDNGSPWGDDWVTHHTILTAWLLRLEIAISHGRPYHPQTQGKDERLNRTLKDEVISRHVMNDLSESQVVFDDWWHTYNYERPHEALNLATPASCYTSSSRPFPDPLPPITYDPEDEVRKVDQSGKIYFHNRTFRVGKAFRYQPVAIRPTEAVGHFDVFFCKQKVAQIHLGCDNQS
jgi:transposase InsO family protein